MRSEENILAAFPGLEAQEQYALWWATLYDRTTSAPGLVVEATADVWVTFGDFPSLCSQLEIRHLPVCFSKIFLVFK